MVGPSSIRDALETVVAGDDLDTATARRLMDGIMEGQATPAQIGAILVALRMKGETVDELEGMVLSMRDHATAVHVPEAAVDTCGTGGDGSGTFNISTAAALVVAGTGCPVAKHGNRSASSRCGSADVLEHLGVVVSLSPGGVERCVREAGIGFMFAPAFHPAMRHVAALRPELGVRTVFNILGPLVSPARVRHQLLGAGNPALVTLIAGVLQRLGLVHALVFSGKDGLDEIGLDGVTQGSDVSPAGVAEFRVDPVELGLDPAPAGALVGGDAAENARRIIDVLSGAGGPARDVVILNAGAALLAADHVDTVAAGVELSRKSIDSGSARDRLQALVAISREEARR